MQHLSPDKQLLIVLTEAVDKRRLYAVSFAIISILIIAVGLVWPKSYKSSTTLIWNKASVIKPLLEGAAITNSGSQQSQNAKEVIYSNKNLNKLIEETELNISPLGDRLSNRDLEILKANLRKMILVERGNNGTIKISYRNKDPDLAYFVVSIISNLFIDETTLSKKTDSEDAYDFIEKQVNEYQEKLEAINKSINDFKRKNVDLQVDSSRGVNDRVNLLRQEIKATTLSLKEAEIQEESLSEQLLIESEKGTIVEEVTIKNDRLIELEDRLSMLRLSYTDTYPDIVQLKDQIRNLKLRIQAAAKSRANNPTGSADSSFSNNSGRSIRSPLYNRLLQQKSTIKTLIKTLSARNQDKKEQLAIELSRSTKVNHLVSKLEDLSRDQEVTKTLYNRLLTKRENARVSLNLEMESAGSLYKIYEPPTVPLVPVGLRFLHFAMLSMVVGAIAPLGLIFGLLLIDPRIRHEDELVFDGSYPVIGTVSKFQITTELRSQRVKTYQSIFLFLLAVAVVVSLSFSRYFEII